MMHHEDQSVSIQAEQSVLGGLIVNNEAIDRCVDLEPRHFYRQDHQIIFAEIQRQIAAGKRVDAVTIFEKLGDSVEDCFRYCVQMQSSAVSAVNIGRHAAIVRDKADKRALAAIAIEAQELASSHNDAAFCVDIVAGKLQELTERKTLMEPRLIGDTMVDYLTMIENRLAGLHKPIPTGYTHFDELMGGGLERGTLTVVAGRPGMGKCLGKGTRIVMYDGNVKKVEDIVPGDILMGDDSTPRNVLSIGRGREQMYWVRQGKGIDYRVNESHILSLKYSRNESGRRSGDVLNIEVRDYMKKSEKFKNNCKGYKVAIDFPSADLPVDPYFLGLWLGDGDTNGARITNVDSEVSDWLFAYAETIGMKANSKKYSERATCIAINKGATGGNDHYKLPCLKNSLRDLSVIGNKHIPMIYIANSVESRMQLLAGLIDSDGHASNGTGYEITQTRKELAEQIKFLCDSLGFKTSITEKATSLKSRDYIGVAYRVRIHGDVHRIPVLIERKKIAPSTRMTNWRVTGINVEADCIDDFYGFEIDGNHLFLLEDMTVTHNTAFGLGIARNVAIDGLSSAILSMEMSAAQVNDRNMSAIGKIPLGWLRSPKDTPNDQTYWDSLSYAAGKAQSLKMWIDEQAGMNMIELRAKVRKIKRKSGLDLLVIDQLSFIQGGDGDQEWQRIGQYTRAIIEVAKSLDIAVVLLAQLNRKCEERTNKRPIMSDLAQSGSIEQDASNIVFLYRDVVYNENTPEPELAEIISMKQRQGVPGTIGMRYNGTHTVFEDLPYRWSPKPAEADPSPNKQRRGFN